MSELLKKQELADELECSLKHVERLLKEGLPFIPLGTRMKRYSLESVLNWLKSRESCLSGKTKKVVGTQRFVSTDNAYTEYCRSALERKKLKARNPNSGNH